MVPEEFEQQFSDAIDLVMRDAEAVLGAGVITHDAGDDDVPGRVIILGEPSDTGFDWHSDMTWPEVVVSVTESIHETVLEDARFREAPFPPCPIHPKHPLMPEIVEGRACWVCVRGGIEPIEIGHLADSADRP